MQIVNHPNNRRHYASKPRMGTPYVIHFRFGKKKNYQSYQSGLTPGSVFCSCSALWAFIADSLSQYVRKAQPVNKGKTSVRAVLQKGSI